MWIFILVAVVVAWIVFTFAFAFVGTSLPQAQKLSATLWNGRIDKMQKPPFSWFLRAYEDKSYLRSFLLVLVCNLPGHLMMFLFGFVKVGLVMVLIQPFM